jgi:hypothetical protein
MPDTVLTKDKISGRAYELYESRGREPGQDWQDWFRAEQEIPQAVKKPANNKTEGQ